MSSYVYNSQIIKTLFLCFCESVKIKFEASRSARLKRQSDRMRKTKEIEVSAVARLFCSTVLKELARKGQSPLFARLLNESHLLGLSCDIEKVFDLFECAFEFLKHKEYRHEYIYKAALTEKVLFGIHSLQTASMISEFRVGDCKADIVILNGTGIVYEIKSERDSLSRLEKQIAAYRNVFARVNVIVGENHVEAVLDSVPEDIGVLKLSGRYQISSIREGSDISSRTNPKAIFDSISLREAELVLIDLGISVPDVPNTRRYQELRKRFAKLDPAAVHTSMVRTLKKTRSLAPLHALVDELPHSLRSAVLSSRLRKQDHTRLVESMKTPISKAAAWA